jgi:hypothetical protein
MKPKKGHLIYKVFNNQQFIILKLACKNIIFLQANKVLGYGV